MANIKQTDSGHATSAGKCHLKASQVCPWQLPCQQLPQNQAKGIDISSSAVGLVSQAYLVTRNFVLSCAAALTATSLQQCDGCNNPTRNQPGYETYTGLSLADQVCATLHQAALHVGIHLVKLAFTHHAVTAVLV